MKGLVIALIIGWLLSLLTKGKKESFESVVTEKMENDNSDIRNFYNTEVNAKRAEKVNRQDKTLADNIVKKKVEKEVVADNVKKKFDIKKAVIYSTILDRPFN